MSHGLEERLEEHDRMKSRKGSIPTNVQTLMKAASMAAFLDEVSKLAVGDTEVVDAAHKLQRPRPWKTIGQTAAMVGAAAPVIDTAGRFAKGAVNTPGGIAARVAGGAKEIRSLTAGDAVAKSLTAGLGGGVIAAAKEGIELHNARKAVREYLEQKVAFDWKSMFGLTPEQRERQKREAEKEFLQAKMLLKGGFGAAGIVAPLATMGPAAESLLGTQRILHGTGPAAAAKILQEGLDPSRGGSGGATWEGSPQFQRASKGHVHVAIPTRGGEGIARFFAHMGGEAEKGRTVDPMASQLALSKGHGKVLSGAMPYEQFVQDFVADPDYESVPGSAFKSTKHVAPTHLGEDSAINRIKKMWQHRAPDIAGYAKRNPKRVAKGLGLAAATVAVPAGGYQVLKSIGGDWKRYQELRETKTSGILGGALSGPAAPKITTPAAPTLGVLRGSSNKSQRVGNTPIAAKSGVTSSASGDAMNPRRNLGDAMRAYKT